MVDERRPRFRTISALPAVAGSRRALASEVLAILVIYGRMQDKLPPFEEQLRPCRTAR